ncbi:MAG: hypothetical protein MJY72_08490 [Bacteroidales bacterium]|nr:hypothetical protein [Bacteroidales bacterium]
MIKRLLILMAAVLMTASFSSESYAQKKFTIPQGADLNQLIPGAYLRPIEKKENAILTTSNVMSITSAAAGVAAVGCAMGAIIYDIEYREIAGGPDWAGYAPKDAQASQNCLKGVYTCAGVAVATGITSIICKSMIRRKTIVKTATGGFVVEF